MAPQSSLKAGDHVFLVDGSSYIFRAHFAMFKAAQSRGRSFTRSDGLPTGAVLTFSNMLWKLLREGLNDIKPSHVAVVFDYSEKTFRNEIYPDYKGHRPDPPSELIPQFPLMREAVKAFGLIPIEQRGFEADDIIATYARQALERGADVTIIAGDKDLMQLVRPGVSMYDPMPGNERRIGPEEVKEKFGVPPEKVPEVQALVGDATDNVPGVPGIGIKTASQLINEYGDLETLLARAPEIKQEKRRASLIEFAEQARISHKLVVLLDNVDVQWPLDDLCLKGASCLEGGDAKTLIAFLRAMEFTSLTKRVAEVTGVDANEIAPEPKFAAGPRVGAEETPAVETGGTPAQAKEPVPVSFEAQLGRALAAAEVLARKGGKPNYATVGDVAALDAVIARAIENGFVGVDLVTTSGDPMIAEIVGISLALEAGEACYIPLGHRASNDLLSGGGLVAGQIDQRDALNRLRPLFENPGVLKIGHDLKPDITVLARHNITLRPFDDVMLMSYVLDAGRAGQDLPGLAAANLNATMTGLADLVGKGRAQVPFAQIEIARACPVCAENPDMSLRLWRFFKTRLVAEHMNTVYETLERPLPPVLASMERHGIMVDRATLSRLSGDFAQLMARLEDEIADLAGERFNLGSPKQLGDILYGKMGLPGATKTPTGAWSTRANVLEELAEQGYELPAKILEWRQVSKLKSTYTDALPAFINPDTGRVHTSFALAATTTGRLASSDPNVQNIPVRTEEGRKIRKAFIASPGYKLISADYSQIELRLLAEIANVPALRQAFRDGTDIHALTASEMFGVPIKDMTPDVRRRAKAINFGIIYGISAFGLANQLGIGRDEAGAYIKKYFERFPGIRDYMEESKAFCREHGYVTTVFGRKMHYPEIKAKNPSLRSFNERAAINARLQGSAADIIRRAMIRMPAALAAKDLTARMLLQVHDELIFEVLDDEIEATKAVVKDVMEKSPEPAVKLTVPLQVDARAAQNWDEAH
ncbi:MAG: DNA polymerase I [Parvibaculaceae bacterium]